MTLPTIEAELGGAIHRRGACIEMQRHELYLHFAGQDQDKPYLPARSWAGQSDSAHGRLRAPAQHHAEIAG